MTCACVALSAPPSPAGRSGKGSKAGDAAGASTGGGAGVIEAGGSGGVWHTGAAGGLLGQGAPQAAGEESVGLTMVEALQVGAGHAWGICICVGAVLGVLCWVCVMYNVM